MTRTASNSAPFLPVSSLVLAVSPAAASMGVRRVPRFEENLRNRVLHVSSMDKRAKETKSDARMVLKTASIVARNLMRRQNGEV